MPERSATHSLARIAFLAAPALLLAGHAAASPIVVLNDGEHRDTIVSHGNYYIQCLEPELSLIPYHDSVVTLYGIYVSFSYFSGELFGGISGNSLPQFPGIPLQTPAIYARDGLRLDGLTLGPSSTGFIRPGYDPILGDVLPSFITHGTSPFSAFNLLTFDDGDMAYIGYATSDISIFGYMQIERVTEVDWKLIGYAYDPSGGGILVQNLVPAPSALALAFLAAHPHSRRRAAFASPTKRDSVTS